MEFDQKIITELSQYKKGSIIPYPDEIVKLKIIFGYRNLVISRRSITHILQKEKVGIFLLNSVYSCLEDFDSVFLSNKNTSEDDKRFIVFKKNLESYKGVAVILEQRNAIGTISVVTAMVADERYLSRKYKRLG